MSQSVPPPPGNPFAARARPRRNSRSRRPPRPHGTTSSSGCSPPWRPPWWGPARTAASAAPSNGRSGTRRWASACSSASPPGKVGGRSPVLGVASAALAAGAVYLGQLVTIAVLLGKMGEGSFTEVFFGNFGGVTDLWGLAADGMTYVFLAIGAVTAFAGARKGSA
ncbi:hypothetical protein [Streptomyces somaliensis]|uniref:hypothetical protein n=1 Tax=Streptomyces somaliensis TaxID=78355 RepID=UPI0034E97871|nr:hypothetical protein [Streptomyces somaliensis]